MSSKITKNQKIALAFIGASAALYGIHRYFKGRQSAPRQPELTPGQKASKHVDQPATKGSLHCFLTQKQAEFRASLIRGPVKYELIFALPKGESYQATATISFELSKVEEGLFLDFNNGTIQRLEINNQVVEASQIYDQKSIKLPASLLVIGHNKIEIDYVRNYANDGNGLHSFVDTDNRQYLYSNCEPWYANRFYPCFDQPDLKANYTVVIIAPSDWVVISNEILRSKDTITNFVRGKGVENVRYQEQINAKRSCFKDDDSVWLFNDTAKISTYLFFIGAGPYKEIKCPEENLHDKVPMSLYVRESLYQYLNQQANEIFTTTTECMKFYESFFGHKYQFSKYDHIFCPEYNVGAMENPGAVTMNDIFVYKEEVVPDKILRRANVVCHELAHMWFGDYVTMRWWNDLWLNESFADFVSYLALSKIKVEGVPTGNSSWMAFFQRKGWGYTTDQQPTTHPIAGPVNDTEQADTIFDGITYSKGASTLKQLTHLIGEDIFSEALHLYFGRYGWSNATLEDFLGAIQEVLEKHFDIKENPHLDIGFWKNEWLCKAGLNEVRAEWNTTTNPHAKMTLIQTPALEQHPTLRYHKFNVAFIDEGANIYDVKNVLLLNQEKTEIEYDGSQMPVAIIPNYGDHAFIKIVFDQKSIDFFKEKLSLIQDDLTRFMVWRGFWDQVRDVRMSTLEFISAVIENFGKEDNLTILETILLYLQGAMVHYCPQEIQKKLSLNGKIFRTLIQKLQETNLSEKSKIILFRDKVIGFAYAEEDIQLVLDWLNGNAESLKSIELTNSNKWKIAQAAARSQKLSYSEKKALIQRINDLDKSDQGSYYARQFGTIFATDQERETIWQSFFDKESKQSVRMFEYTMFGFNDDSNIERNQKYYRAFFDNVQQVFTERSKEFAKAFFEYLFPISDNVDALLVEVRKLIQNTPEDRTWLIKLLREKEDLLARKSRVFELVRRNPNL